MNLVFVVLPGYDKSGPSRHLIYDTLSFFVKNGINVTFLSFKTKEKDNGQFSPLDVNTHNYKCVLKRRNHFFKKNFVLRYLSDLWLVLKLIPEIIKLKKTDIFHLYSINSSWLLIFLIKRFTKAKVILNVQDVFPLNGLYSNLFAENSIVYQVFNKLQCYLYRKADKIIAISLDIKHTLINYGVESNKIQIIYNWMEEFDVNEEDIEDAYLKLNLQKDKKYIVYAGNIGTMQNVEIILELFLPFIGKNYCLLIVGEGNEKAFLQKKYGNYEDILFLEKQPAKLANALYLLADLNTIALKDKVVFTALPSKTPACLNSEKPLLVVTNVESSYATIIKEYSKGYILDVNKKDYKEVFAQSLCDEKTSNGKEIADLYFSKKKNLIKYVELIKGGL